jgi:hypothetical protein
MKDVSEDFGGYEYDTQSGVSGAFQLGEFRRLFCDLFVQGDDGVDAAFVAHTDG